MAKNSFKLLIMFLYFVIYCVASTILFINIYDINGYVVDELFHIPQGLQFCQWNFSTWDSKITTLPGLYLASTLLMAPFNFCTFFGLRLTNLITSFFNIFLFTSLFHIEYDRSKPVSWRTIISGASLSIFPPLYMFNHLYYTETLSVMTVLLMMLFSKINYHIFASVCGICSILMRQTNVIWVAMLLGNSILEAFVKVAFKKPIKDFDFWILYKGYKNLNKTGVNLKNLQTYNYRSLFSYFLVLGMFVGFVIINGSIVVGDKSAHEAVIHIPQLFYFFLFCAVFTLPHIMLEVIPFVKFTLRNKLLVAGCLATFISIVHYNTLVHPYLLADNRHYIFYVWMRIYAKYWHVKYLLTVVYLFAIFAILQRIDFIKNFGFLLVYVPSLILVLTLQKLLDLRYFIIPYIILRLKFKTNIFVLIAEYLLYLVINFCTFYIFFTKEIMWSDFDYVQRIIW